jgi:hypothetical protein
VIQKNHSHGKNPEPIKPKPPLFRTLCHYGSQGPCLLFVVNTTIYINVLI